jgi:uncharacterized membrane protein
MERWKKSQLKADFVSIKCSGVAKVVQREPTAGNGSINQASPSRNSSRVPALVESPSQVDEGVFVGSA